MTLGQRLWSTAQNAMSRTSAAVHSRSPWARTWGAQTRAPHERGSHTQLRLRRAAPLALALLTACATRGAPQLQLAPERVARAKALRAPERAPRAFETFEQVKRRAEHAAADDPERADLETEARLWLETAIAIAATQDLAAERLRLEERIHGQQRAALRDERDRSQLARTHRRELSAKLARAEAKTALAHAAEGPARQPRLEKAAVRRAAEALLVRAELVRAASRTLGEANEVSRALDAKLARARGKLTARPEQALALADEALFSAFALLGPVRAERGSPSDEERGSLAEALDLAGAEVSRSDAGLSAVLPDAFAGARLQQRASRVLTRLCALTQAHPHGDLKAVTRGSSAREAQLRARAVDTQLRRLSCASGRLRAESLVNDGPAWTLTWLAY